MVKTELKESKYHDFVYHALFGNTVKFLVPTISLVVFSILIIREVCFSKRRLVDPLIQKPFSISVKEIDWPL